MKTKQNGINKRLRNLEKKIDAYDTNESKGTGELLDLAEEYQQIMQDFRKSLFDNDLDYWLQ